MDWLNLLSHAIVGLISALGGSFGVWVLNFYKEKRIQDSSLSQAEFDRNVSANDQAVKIFKEIIEVLRSNYADLVECNETLERNYINTKVENARLKVQLEVFHKKERNNDDNSR